MACAVLVVEDHPDCGEAYVLMLRKAGFGAYLARSVGEAQAFLATMVPDVMLVDYNLGAGGDGLDFLTDVAGHPEWRLVPVLMMSAAIASDRLVTRAIQLGARGWIEKTTLHARQIVRTVTDLCPEDPGAN